jgi:hypothetical protein
VTDVRSLENVVTIVVVIFGLVGMCVCLTVGIASGVVMYGRRQAVAKAVDSVVGAQPPAPGIGPLPPAVQNQSLSSALDSVSKIASALKDLDRVAQMFTLALGFLAVAAVAAGVDAIAGALD